MTKRFTSIEELLLKTPLYESLSVDDESKAAKEILTFSGAVDTYCPGCKQPATFRGTVTQETQDNIKRANAAAVAIGPGRPTNPFKLRNFSKKLHCTRVGHVIDYHFVCEGGHIIKVGQYPSIADIEKGDTDRYEAVLGRERLKELNRAIGLASHGVGIGAHVYLRRIFEWLVEEAHRIAQLTPEGWDEAKYQQGRMAERIKMLRGLLPDFLSENPRLYAILSQGIHELTEDECLANFEALKLCIEVTLDEKLRQKAQEERAEAARKALARIDGRGAQGKSEGA